MAPSILNLMETCKCRFFCDLEFQYCKMVCHRCLLISIDHHGFSECDLISSYVLERRTRSDELQMLTVMGWGNVS
jgi:hypothetical protein